VVTKKSQQAAQQFDFEAALDSLEALVNAMEEGELSLEESLQAFEKGIRLTRECQQALQQAEQKVQRLIDENGTTEPIEFEDQEDN
jgi:exodeoxyribonuclease VII small subunit